MNLKNVVAIGIISTFMLLSTATVAKSYTIKQLNKTFITNGKKVAKLEIKNGDSIKFENSDPFFHNIFSLSDLKTFDLGSYPSGEWKSVLFNKSGLIEIECAIHPQMYLEVTIK